MLDRLIERRWIESAYTARSPLLFFQRHGFSPEVRSLHCERVSCNARSARKCSLRRALPEEDLANHYTAEYEPGARRWTDDAFRVDDPAVVVGLFRMLAFNDAADEAFEEFAETYLYEAARTT